MCVCARVFAFARTHVCAHEHARACEGMGNIFLFYSRGVKSGDLILS